MVFNAIAFLFRILFFMKGVLVILEFYSVLEHFCMLNISLLRLWLMLAITVIYLNLFIQDTTYLFQRNHTWWCKAFFFICAQNPLVAVLWDLYSDNDWTGVGCIQNKYLNFYTIFLVLYIPIDINSVKW